VRSFLPSDPCSLTPFFGAVREDAGVRFRVFAIAGHEIRLELLSGAAAGVHGPVRNHDGVCEFFVRGAGAGDRYVYVLGGSERRPDPASRFQPEGVHGPSEVIDPAVYAWLRSRWRGRTARELVIYELHIGTFTSQGTFAAAQERLPNLRDLGVTAIEVMPIAEFAGTRNWGYDGVCLYAPSRNYGRPDDFRAFVDAAHSLDLAVILDVVYNHLGPEGAYLTQFHPGYITDRHSTPWGGAVNLDGPGSELVRQFIIDNALSWLREYRLDGLRLDATHALIDTSPTHVVAELVAEARSTIAWPVVFHGEDSRNLTELLEPRARGGWGLDGVWADDFHHVVRRKLAGDAHGYYRDYAGTCGELERTLRQGWLFTGQHSTHQRAPRGTDPSAIPMHRFIVCLQNHDQVGNRATGDRLHHGLDPAAWRAASVVLLTVPMTPLLFMGQEWAASAPFQFFTDLEPGLGAQVAAGRSAEFTDFPGFSQPESRERIPNPQAQSTFERSRLNWDERGRDVHRETLALYTELLRLRAAHPALGASAELENHASAADADTIVMHRGGAAERFAVVAQLTGGGTVVIDSPSEPPAILLTTEDPRFAIDPQPIAVEVQPQRIAIRFHRPGAVIFEWSGGGDGGHGTGSTRRHGGAEG
jgi:maltooligosyltrehalose trehalohydrolase